MSAIYEAFKNDDLEMKFQNDTLQINGIIDYREPEKILGTFFDNLHKQIINMGLKNIKIDITNLSFLNSAGIKEFVEWIMKIESLKPDNKYKITFLTNSELLWQESSISTLIYLNPEYIERVIKK